MLELGSTNPANEMRNLRRYGFLIVHVQSAGEPFWVAPELAADNGVDWSKRMLARLKQGT